jgi:hypothetical protein
MSGTIDLLGLEPEKFNSSVQKISAMSDNIVCELTVPDANAIMPGLTNILEIYSENIVMMADYKEALKTATTLMLSAGKQIIVADATVLENK